MSLKKLDALRKRAARRVTNADELLTEIRRLIVEEPRRYNQGVWRAIRGSNATQRPFPACGTVGCVAGWVCHLDLPQAMVLSFGVSAMGRHEIATHAEQVLGLSRDQAAELFDHNAANGSHPLKHTNAQTTAHARAGAKHIRAFQKKYRDQLRGTPVEVRL